MGPSSVRILKDIHVPNILVTAHKRSCGKVMFLHLSVILFTGGVSVQRREGSLSRGGKVSLSRGGRGSLSRGVYIQGRGSLSRAYGRRAGGTHPTGMHSCFSNEDIFFQLDEMDRISYARIGFNYNLIQAQTSFWCNSWSA